jgi:tetratricopeptide (TPR) repeat protein
MAVLLVDAGSPDQAMKHLMAVYPEADACYKLGFLLQAKGQPHQAIGAFSRALALNPSMKEARSWLEHLRSVPGDEPRMARRPTGVSNTPESPPPERSPSSDLDRDEPIAPAPEEQDPPPAPRGSVRQLPAAVKRLPEPPVKRLPEPEPAPSPATGPVPWPRRLPPTSAERPAAHEESDGELANAARRLDVSIDEPLDAPLPTARPRANPAPRGNVLRSEE